MTAWVTFEARLVAVDRTNRTETQIACVHIDRAGDSRFGSITSADKTMIGISTWVTPDKADHEQPCVEARNIRANGVLSALRRALRDVGKRSRYKPDPNEIPF